MVKTRVLFAVLSASVATMAGSGTGLAQEEAQPVSFAAAALPDAKPGECYAKVLVPAQYKTETEEVVKRDAYEELNLIPAKYEEVEEQVLVKEATEILEPVDPVYETFEEIVEIMPARRVWRLGNKPKSKIASPTIVAGAMAFGLPKDAEPGQCFAEFYVPAEYQDEEQTVLVKEAAEKIEVIPAQYETVTETVVVKEAGEQLLEVPAVYETVTEEVLEKPAYTTWKKGRGPVERIDGTTGEIMCLVEIPAKYKTIEKTLLRTAADTVREPIPADEITVEVAKLVSGPQQNKVEISAEETSVTKKVKVADENVFWRAKDSEGPGEPTGGVLCLAEIPAQLKTVERRVLKTPATVNKIEIPAEYKTVKVQKLVAPPQIEKIPVPAETQAVTRQVKVADARMEWRSVLCETNMSQELNTRIQQALVDAGYNPGEVDGVLGRQTMVAVDAFQRDKDLPRGGLTMKTLEVLGVKVGQ